MTKIPLTSKTCEWSTPQDFFERLDQEYGFTLDPCATPENAKCKKFFTYKTNGLAQDWSNEIVFCNPPYGREIGKWVEKAYFESKRGATVVCLVPARTDTRWFHNFAKLGNITFVKGRLKFNGSTSSAPFPSMLIEFKN